jgi:hypothetical protein
MGSAASGGWTQYVTAGVRMGIPFLVFEIKYTFFSGIFVGCMKIPDAWMPDNQEFTAFGSLVKMQNKQFPVLAL